MINLIYHKIKIITYTNCLQLEFISSDTVSLNSLRSMPGKWQTLNGVRYPVDDHASPRTSEEYNPYEDPSFQRRIASLKADMRGSKKGGTLDDNLYPNHPYNTRKNGGGTSREVKVDGLAEIQRDMRRLLITFDNKEQKNLKKNKTRWGMTAKERLEKAQNSVDETPICHPVGWTAKNHYSELGWQWCGQSCPCCRARAGDTLGACPICAKQ